MENFKESSSHNKKLLSIGKMRLPSHMRTHFICNFEQISFLSLLPIALSVEHHVVRALIISIVVCCLMLVMAMLVGCQCQWLLLVSFVLLLLLLSYTACTYTFIVYLLVNKTERKKEIFMFNDEIGSNKREKTK